MRVGAYLKKAFLNHWNLLAVGAGAAFGFLTGRPDIVLPVVAAGEIAYLGMLATHPRFQKAVDAQAAKERRVQGSVRSEETLERITAKLPRSSIEKYEILRRRAQELRQIATDLRHPDAARSKLPFEDLQMEGLDRLLWIYLRLLYTEWSLSRFLDRTSERAILDDIERLEGKLARIPVDDRNPRRQKARHTIEDNLATSRARLANLRKATENHELVQLEIDRLENKIRSLSELAVNRQEPDFISDQITATAESMLETEKTMNELEFATGLAPVDEQVPEMMERSVLRTETS